MSPVGSQAAFKATLAACRSAAGKATQALVHSWPVIPASLGLFLLHSLLSNLLQGFGMAGGFVLGMIQITLLSIYYGWLADLAHGQKLRFKDLMSLDYGLFSDVINTAFVLYLITFVLQTIGRGGSLGNLQLIVQLVIAVVLNSLAEAVYISRRQGLDALSHAASFMRSNWIEWLITWLLPLIPACGAGIGYFALMLATSEPLLPALLPAGVLLRTVLGFAPARMFFSGDLGFLALGGTVLVTVLTNWLMLFRADLYKWLDTSSRRSRAFREAAR